MPTIRHALTQEQANAAAQILDGTVVELDQDDRKFAVCIPVFETDAAGNVERRLLAITAGSVDYFHDEDAVRNNNPMNTMRRLQPG